MEWFGSLKWTDVPPSLMSVVSSWSRKYMMETLSVISSANTFIIRSNQSMGPWYISVTVQSCISSALSGRIYQVKGIRIISSGTWIFSPMEISVCDSLAHFNHTYFEDFS